MDFTAIVSHPVVKTIAHAAVGGGLTALAGVSTDGPMTPESMLAPFASGALTSAFSAARDASQANPMIHALIGAAPIVAIAVASGDHAAIGNSLLPALVSAMTSAYSSRQSVK